jgi:hypothetical protein
MTSEMTQPISRFLQRNQRFIGIGRGFVSFVHIPQLALVSEFLEYEKTQSVFPLTKPKNPRL